MLQRIEKRGRTVATFIFVSLISSFVFASGGVMAIMGDAGEASKELDQLRASIAKASVSSVIMPGDNLYKGTYNQVWDSWKKAGMNFDVVAIGNHTDGYAKEVAYFGMPGEYYSVVKNGARFLVLNSDNTANVKEQFSWLEKEINQVQEKLVFVVFHHPTFTISKNHKWTEKKDFQTRMRQFLKDHGSRLAALMLGHDHFTTFMDFGSIPVIVSGGGREVRPASAVSFVDDGFHVQTRFLAPEIQHWTKLEISADAQEATISAVRVSDQSVTCSARLSHGTMTLEGSCP